MIGIFGDSQELSFDFNFKVAGDNNHPLKLYSGAIDPNNPAPPTTYPKMILDFKGKTRGNLVSNPNIAKRASSSTLLQPNSFTYEEEYYSNISILDGITQKQDTNAIGNIPQQLFSFNIVEGFERQYGKIPNATDLASKVAWLKSNLSKIQVFWYGYGVNPTGNKAYLNAWAGNTWSSYPTSHTADQIASLGLNWTTTEAIDRYFNSDGFVHILAYTDTSDENTVSRIYTDYIQLEVSFKDQGQVNNVIWNEVKDQKIYDKLKENDSTGIVETTQDYVNDYFVPLRDSVEGGRVAVEVEGNTMQNLAGLGGKGYNSNSLNVSSGVTIEGDTNKTIVFTGQGEGATNYMNITFPCSQPLKDNTTYTIIIDVLENTLETDFTAMRSQDVGTVVYIPSKFTGIFIKEFQTKQIVNSVIHQFIARNRDVTERIKVRNIRLIEGKSGIVSYFEGIKHIDSCVVKSVGKNLFDGVMEKGGLNSGDGNGNSNSNSVRTSNFIHLEAGTTYKVSQDGASKAVNACFYYQSKSFLQYISGISTITMPSSAYYVKFYYTVNSENTEKLQIEKGSVITPYEPYKEDKIDISSAISGDKALKRLPNDVHDTFGTDGIITRNIGQSTYNGSENWKRITTTPHPNYVRFYLENVSKMESTAGKITTISDVIPSTNFSDIYNDRGKEGVAISNSSTNLSCKVLNSRLTPFGFKEDDVNTWIPAFKEFLKVNNMTVCYELLEPTQEDTKNPINLETSKDGSLVIDSNLPPYVREWHTTDPNDTGTMTWISSTSGLASAYLVEIDLTGICNSLYGGSNSALKNAFKSLSSRVYMSGSGVDNGVQKNGAYIRTVYNNVNYSQAGWADFGIISSNSITGITISSTTNDRISNANKVYLLIQSRYPSGTDSQGNFAPSILNLDYVSAKVTLSRQPDIVKPVDIELTDTWSILIKGLSPAWSTTDGYVDWRRIFEMGNTTNRISLQYNSVKGLTLFYWDSTNNVSKVILTLPQREYEKFTSSNLMVQYNKGEFKLYWLTNGNDKPSVNTATKVMDSLEGKLYICQSVTNNYQSNAFIDSFQYMPNKTWTDEEAEEILRGAKEGFEMPNLFDYAKEKKTSTSNPPNFKIDSENKIISFDADISTQYAIGDFIEVLPNNKYSLNVETNGKVYIYEYYNDKQIKLKEPKPLFTTSPYANRIKVNYNAGGSIGHKYFKNLEIKLKM